MTRDEVHERLRAWVGSEDHYYVGYEFGGAGKDMSASFERLVDVVFGLVSADTARLDWLDANFGALYDIHGALVRSDGSLTLRRAIDDERRAGKDDAGRF